ncbi:MAG: hypothetical protein QHC67_10595 [Sphingobium sp.]|uniref:hypothetical protein n=1 Tax=Sphingobium sp. TaxID=1912891 RepID=UPI0029B4293C|nr:hypothetical protein [Sphingobium sp.]MDX3910254.1 hypothetical protein [Sphingobium sp.]
MFGLPSSRLFRSRRAALLWAAGILLGAWSFASDQPESLPAEIEAAANAQVSALVSAF